MIPYQSGLNFSNPSHNFTQGYFLQVKLSTLNDVHHILIKNLFDDYQLQKNEPAIKFHWHTSPFNQ